MFAYFSLTILGVAEHSDDVDASTPERQMVCGLGHINDGLDEIVLYDELDAILIRTDMP